MKRLSVIADKEFDCRDMEEERVKGELLTANGYRVPKGAERVELENYYDPACRPLAIRLDKNLTANENAQAYFKRYQKKKRTLAAVLPQREEVEAERRYLSTVRAEAELAERAEEFAALEAELAENGYLRLSGSRKKTDEGARGPRLSDRRIYGKGGKEQSLQRFCHVERPERRSVAAHEGVSFRSRRDRAGKRRFPGRGHFACGADLRLLFGGAERQ